VVLMTIESQRPWTVAPACPALGMVAPTALPSVVETPSTRVPGHVIGVTPMASRPESVQIKNLILGGIGYVSDKPEFQSTKVDGLRGVPPRGRPV
jgi:hypothetical protein